MSVRQIANLAYAHLAQGRNTVQMAELQALLSGGDDEQVRDERNAAAMQQLQGFGLAPPTGAPA